MSDVASSDIELSPVIQAAAGGDLPPWSCISEQRRAHARRVAELLGEWADDLRLEPSARKQWRAAGWLHDALKDADPADLSTTLPEEYADLPSSLLHGPAAAEHLMGEASPELVLAVRYHTIGHPALDRMGRALYIADFLEPGRSDPNEWRAALRARMPGDMDRVLSEVAAARIRTVIERRRQIPRETAEFWNDIVRDSR